MNFFEKLFVKSNGNPHGWVKNLLFTNDFRPVEKWKFLSMNSNGGVRQIFSAWHERMLCNPSYQTDPDWLDHEIYPQKIDLQNPLQFVIIAPPSVEYVARMLRFYFSRHHIDVDISRTMPIRYDADYYIVICPQVYSRLPPRHKLISFQMEQSISSNWFTNEYLNLLYNSNFVLDYSKRNIEYLSGFNYLSRHVFYFPISPIDRKALVDEASHAANNKEFDVLFYGDPKSERRQKFLKALKSKFNTVVLNHTYGLDVWKLLIKAKLIVNIHYYENALLETTRLSECLSLGLRIVSEESHDQDVQKLFDEFVDFTPVGDVDAMVVRVQELLKTIDFAQPRHCNFSSFHGEKFFLDTFGKFMGDQHAVRT